MHLNLVFAKFWPINWKNGYLVDVLKLELVACFQNGSLRGDMRWILTETGMQKKEQSKIIPHFPHDRIMWKKDSWDQP